MRTAILTILLLTAHTLAGELTIRIPADMKLASASAVAPSDSVAGKCDADGARFKKLQPGLKYDITLEAADGLIVQGVDSGWYNDESANPNAADMDDDDRLQIDAILKIKSFYDSTEALRTWGNHDRAVLLVQRIRDSAFHSDKGGEAIWRVELWYLKNEAGGWAKVNQQDRVICRQRFDTSAAMKEQIAKIRWRTELGGIRVGKDETKTITLPKEQPKESGATTK